MGQYADKLVARMWAVGGYVERRTDEMDFIRTFLIRDDGKEEQVQLGEIGRMERAGRLTLGEDGTYRLSAYEIERLEAEGVHAEPHHLVPCATLEVDSSEVTMEEFYAWLVRVGSRPLYVKLTPETVSPIHASTEPIGNAKQLANRIRALSKRRKK